MPSWSLADFGARHWVDLHLRSREKNYMLGILLLYSFFWSNLSSADSSIPERAVQPRLPLVQLTRCHMSKTCFLILCEVKVSLLKKIQTTGYCSLLALLQTGVSDSTITSDYYFEEYFLYLCFFEPQAGIGSRTNHCPRRGARKLEEQESFGRNDPYYCRFYAEQKQLYCFVCCSFQRNLPITVRANEQPQGQQKLHATLFVPVFLAASWGRLDINIFIFCSLAAVDKTE